MVFLYLQQVKALQAEHDDLVACTKSLAEYNLTFEPKIENKKLCIASGYEKLSSIKTSFQETKAKLSKYSFFKFTVLHFFAA